VNRDTPLTRLVWDSNTTFKGKVTLQVHPPNGIGREQVVDLAEAEGAYDLSSLNLWDNLCLTVIFDGESTPTCQTTFETIIRPQHTFGYTQTSSYTTQQIDYCSYRYGRLVKWSEYRDKLGSEILGNHSHYKASGSWVQWQGTGTYSRCQT
jgi:hypothetical protein